jgi:hypothetical protein
VIISEPKPVGLLIGLRHVTDRLEGKMGLLIQNLKLSIELLVAPLVVIGR